MNDAGFTSGRATTYRHSGRVPLAGWIMSFAILIPVALVAGIIYSGIVVYLPFLKLRCLITLGYGALLGVIVGAVCRKVKFRNHAAVAFMTLLITAISFYAAWAVHCAWFILSVDGFTKDVAPAFLFGFDPRVIYGWGQYIVQNGLWVKNGNPHNGWAAIVGWIVEALIVFVTAFIARKSYGNDPFCEDCERWTDENKDLASLPVSPTDHAWQQVSGGNIGSIRKLQLVQQSPEYVELRLASCPSCTSSDFLSAVAVQMTLNKDGNLEKKETDIFRSMPISAAQKAEILEFAEDMAEAQRIMNEELADEELESDDSPAT